jgi:hypothetical protein
MLDRARAGVAMFPLTSFRPSLLYVANAGLSIRRACRPAPSVTTIGALWARCHERRSPPATPTSAKSRSRRIVDPVTGELVSAPATVTADGLARRQ